MSTAVFQRVRPYRAPDGTLGFIWDPLRIVLFTLTILNVSRMHQHYHSIARLRPALLLVIVAGTCAFLQPTWMSRFNVFRRWPMRLIAILAILACLSTAFGISLGGSATYIINEYSKTLLFCFLLAASVRHVRDLYTYVWAYVISCGILGFFSLFVFGLAKSGAYVTRLNNLYTYDSNDVCVVLMVGLPLTLLLLLAVRGKLQWLLLLNLYAICATIARAGSRGGFIGFVVLGASATLLVTMVSVQKRILLVAAAAAALYFGAPPGYWEQMQTILQPKEDYNYSAIDGRKQLMERGIGYMSLFPVFGLGISNFPRAECTISPKLAKLRRGGPIRCKAPHNSYIEAGSETGVPGLITWVSMLFVGIFGMLRVRLRLPRWWMHGTDAERFLYGAPTFIALSVIGFAVTSFFVSFAWVDTIYIVMALITGWYASMDCLKPAFVARAGLNATAIPKAAAPAHPRRLLPPAGSFPVPAR